MNVAEEIARLDMINLMQWIFCIVIQLQIIAIWKKFREKK